LRVEEIEAVAEWLRELDIQFVIVGGSAIERSIAVGTGDVDVLIAVGQWEAIEKALENNRQATPLEPYSGTIRPTRLKLGTSVIDLEFISGEPFAGTHSADEFIEYVRNYRSEKSKGVRYATPPVVWYMRLSIDDQWEQYASKIRRDIISGVPASTLDAVVDIGDHFGVGDRIRERVGFVRRILRLYEKPDKV
jgi:hypothetical protein